MKEKMVKWFKNVPEDDWKELRRECRNAARALLIVLLAVLVLSALTGCKSVEYVPVEVETVKTDTVNVYRLQRDSVYLTDSVFVCVKMAGDTVFVDRYKEKTRWIERVKYDSVFVASHDTIPAPYEVKVEVERKKSGWEKFVNGCGWFFLVIMSAGLVYAGWVTWRSWKL